MVFNPTSAKKLEDLERFHAGLTLSLQSTLEMVETYSIDGLDSIVEEMRRALRAIEAQIVKLRSPDQSAGNS